MRTQHKMPEKGAIELSNRQQQILYDREVKGLSRKEIASRYERLDGSANLKIRGVESYLREARKKRRLAVNTIVYADQIGYFDITTKEFSLPNEFSEYVDVPDEVHHNDTALFEQQKRILHLIVECNNDNREIVKQLIDKDYLTEMYKDLHKNWNDSELLRTAFKEYLDGNHTNPQEETEQRIQNDQNLVDDILSHTDLWSREQLETETPRQLFCKKVAAEELYDKKYSTLRQYKYYRIPEKLKACIKTAQKP